MDIIDETEENEAKEKAEKAAAKGEPGGGNPSATTEKSK